MAFIPGLAVPAGLVQPFFVRFRSDDLHVIAFFSGHPVYEAAEAMITKRRDETFAIRAILTRRDQTQIDHINDAALAAQMRGAEREVCEREIHVVIGGDERRPRVAVAFASQAGEYVVLDLTSIGPFSREGAGLTDPGDHSLNASLPLMWRCASTLAGPESFVSIDGVRTDIPVKFQTASMVALEGYLTEQHSMGVFRAGSELQRIQTMPTHLEPGAEWAFDRNGQVGVYRIVSRAADGELRIDRFGGPRETIFARQERDNLRVRTIHIPADEQSNVGLEIVFGENRTFEISIDDAQRVIWGRVETESAASFMRIRLLPVEPAWATRRAVDVECRRKGNDWRLQTRIGASDI